MLATYAPWGRPGCGAPDPEARERRKRYVTQQRVEGTRRFACGNGSSGQESQDGRNGASGRRWARNASSGGCGAPIRTRSGRIVATRHSDPLLLFQPQAPMRKCVEEELRYRKPAESKMAYKRELDDLVQQRRRAEAEEYVRLKSVDRLLGWTGTEDDIRENRERSPKERRRKNDCGVELVPLLIQRRVPKKCHVRCITDVTGERAYWNSTREDKRARGTRYLHELDQQVACKQQRAQAMQQEDLASSLRHAERWQQIWSSDPRVTAAPRAARCLGYGGGCLLPRRRYGMGEAAAFA